MISLFKGRYSEADESLQRIRGQGFDIGPELADLKADLTKRRVSMWSLGHTETRTDESQNSASDLCREFRKPSVYKPTLLLITIWVFQQFCGNYAIIFYAVDVVR